MWHLAWEIFIVFPTPLTTGIPPPRPKDLWEGPINSICQLVIILMANIFLASRIYGLTKSRLQCYSVIALSAVAFALGMATNVMAWKNLSFPTVRRNLSIAWHAIQAAVECLITFLLSRVLLNARSGMRQSDSTINYIVRSIIQTGCLATAWALAALATWFLLPRISAYRVFDITSGTVYTHAMFETLLSRIRLRERLKLPSYIHIGMQRSQGGWMGSSKTSGHPSPTSIPGVGGLSSAPLNASGLESGSIPASKVDVIELETLG